MQATRSFAVASHGVAGRNRTTVAVAIDVPFCRIYSHVVQPDQTCIHNSNPRMSDYS